MRFEKLILSLGLCVAVAVITGCATVNTSQTEEAPEEEVGQQKRKKAAKKAPARKKRKRVASSRKVSVQTTEVSMSSTVVAVPDDSLSGERSGISWWLAALPLAVISAGIYGVRRRKHKPIVSIQTGGTPPGPSPPGRPPS